MAALTVRYLPLKPMASSQRKSLAIIKLDALGDFFIGMTFFHNLREFFPENEYELTLITQPPYFEVAKEFTPFDNFIMVSTNEAQSSIKSFIQSLLNLKKYSFDIVINLSYSRTWQDDCFLFSLRSKIKIGHDGDHSNINPKLKAISNNFYSKLIPPSKNVNEFIKNKEILQSVNIDYEYKFDSIIQNISRENIGLFIGSSWDGKCWDIEKFSYLAREFINKGYKIVLLGGPNDLNYRDQFIKIMEDYSDSIQDLIGQTTIKEMIFTISNLRLLISNDTSAVHAATLSKTPTIVIMGGGHFGRFTPKDYDLLKVVNFYMDCYQCLWQCPFYKEGKPVPCIEKIDAHTVFEICNKLLN